MSNFFHQAARQPKLPIICYRFWLSSRLVKKKFKIKKTIGFTARVFFKPYKNIKFGFKFKCIYPLNIHEKQFTICFIFNSSGAITCDFFLEKLAIKYYSKNVTFLIQVCTFMYFCNKLIFSYCEKLVFDDLLSNLFVLINIFFGKLSI